MNTKKIIWYNKPSRLNQAFTSGIEFSFVTPDGYQITPFAFCKDYLQDAIQSRVLNKKRGIYGFSYDPKSNYLISFKSTDLLITNSKDHEFENKIPNCLDFINSVENYLGIKNTIVFKCENPPNKYAISNVFYFKGSNRWIKSAPMISMYTLFIRLGFRHTIGESFKDTINKIAGGKLEAYQSVDNFRLRSSLPGIKYILDKGDVAIFGKKIRENYPESISISTMHNKLGVSNFTNKTIRKKMPQWFKDYKEEVVLSL